MKKTMLWGFFLFLLSPFCTLGQGIDFSELSLDEALQVAQRENKKVFIDFYTVWCGPCKQLSRDVFPQKAVGDYFNPRFISLKCDAEKGDGPALARKYGVRAYPTLVFLDAKGELLYSFAGASDAATLIERVQRGLDENLSSERLQARYAGGERTPELIYYYAISLFENGKDQDAYAVIEDYFAHLSEQEKCSEENFKIYERYILNLDHPIARYVLAHYPQFFATVGEERTRVLLRKWLWQATMPYVIVRENTSLSLAAFRQLQQDIVATGLNTGSYPAMLQLGEYKTFPRIQFFGTLPDSDKFGKPFRRACRYQSQSRPFVGRLPSLNRRTPANTPSPCTQAFKDRTRPCGINKAQTIHS